MENEDIKKIIIIAGIVLAAVILLRILLPLLSIIITIIIVIIIVKALETSDFMGAAKEVFGAISKYITELFNIGKKNKNKSSNENDEKIIIDYKII